MHLLPSAAASAFILTACTILGLFHARPAAFPALYAYQIPLLLVAIAGAVAAVRLHLKGGRPNRLAALVCAVVLVPNGIALLFVGWIASGVALALAAAAIVVAFMQPALAVVRPSRRLDLLAPAALLGAVSLVFPLGLGSIESQARALDVHSAVAYAQGSRATPLLLDMQREALYFWQCGERVHASRAYLRASILLLRTGAEDLIEYRRRVLAFDDAVEKVQIAAAARPDLRDADFDRLWNDTVALYLKTPSIP